MSIRKRSREILEILLRAEDENLIVPGVDGKDSREIVDDIRLLMSDLNEVLRAFSFEGKVNILTKTKKNEMEVNTSFGKKVLKERWLKYMKPELADNDRYFIIKDPEKANIEGLKVVSPTQEYAWRECLYIAQHNPNAPHIVLASIYVLCKDNTIKPFPFLLPL